jgi:tetratricopeptide (TPR) repeat protein
LLKIRGGEQKESVMLEFGACPQCKLDISPERKKIRPIICNHCGYTSGNDQKLENEIQKKTIIAFFAVSIFVIAAHIQLSNWDKYSLSIIPLTVKEMMGADGPADFEAKSEMCMELKKWDCVEAAYLKAAAVDPVKYQRAGDFQMKRQKWNPAAQSYYKFFQAGQQNLDASYSYAKALAKLGQVDDAVKYFDQVLAAKPDVLQVTVVQNYVKLLMDAQRFDQAKVLISKIRKDSGPAGESFMEDEFKKIKDLASRD